MLFTACSVVCCHSTFMFVYTSCLHHITHAYSKLCEITYGVHMYVRTMHTGESAVHSEPAVGRERGAAEGEVRVVRSN